MSTQIETHASLEAFFGELLKDALSEEKLKLEDSSTSYLLRLFSDLGDASTFRGSERQGEVGTPALVWLFERAQVTDRGKRFDAYRHLGDVSLFVSGFFATHVVRERSLVGIDYYVQMGSSAYGQAASLAHPSGFGMLLAELAEKFSRLVEVLTRVAERTTLPIARDVVALYDRFRRSPENLELERRLVERGMIPSLKVVGIRS